MNVMMEILSPMMAAVTSAYLNLQDSHAQPNLSQLFALRSVEMELIMDSINEMMAIQQMATAVLPLVLLKVDFVEIKKDEMISEEMDLKPVDLTIEMMRMSFGEMAVIIDVLHKLDLSVQLLTQPPALNNAMDLIFTSLLAKMEMLLQGMGVMVAQLSYLTNVMKVIL